MTRRLLVLALLFHDVGKWRDEDHASESVRMAQQMLERLRMPPASPLCWGGPLPPAWQRAWVNQALALCAWRELAPRTLAASSGPTPAWQEECDRLHDPALGERS